LPPQCDYFIRKPELKRAAQAEVEQGHTREWTHYFDRSGFQAQVLPAPDNSALSGPGCSSTSRPWRPPPSWPPDSAPPPRRSTSICGPCMPLGYWSAPGTAALGATAVATSATSWPAAHGPAGGGSDGGVAAVDDEHRAGHQRERVAGQVDEAPARPAFRHVPRDPLRPVRGAGAGSPTRSASTA